MISTPCLEPGCPNMAQPGPRRARCRGHQKAWDRARNARPERAVYQQGAYRYDVRGQRCAIRIDGVCTLWATTVDHIIPVSEGGTDHPSNLRPACRECNSSRARRKT
ncbi:MAG: HNH endonuclease [Acidimicrobiales bacterium]